MFLELLPRIVGEVSWLDFAEGFSAVEMLPAPAATQCAFVTLLAECWQQDCFTITFHAPHVEIQQLIGNSFQEAVDANLTQSTSTDPMVKQHRLLTNSLATALERSLGMRHLRVSARGESLQRDDGGSVFPHQTIQSM